MTPTSGANEDKDLNRLFLQVDDVLRPPDPSDVRAPLTVGYCLDLIERLFNALRECEEEKGKLGRYRQEIQAALNGEKMVVGCSEEGVRIEQAKQEVERLKGELGRALERERSAVEVSRYWNKMWNQERQRVQELREALEQLMQEVAYYNPRANVLAAAREVLLAHRVPLPTNEERE